jgi:hypothetical protein
MKKPLLISVLLTVLLTSASSHAQGNLIINGSFESTNTAYYPGFYAWAVGGTGFSQGYSGQYGSVAPDGNRFAFFTGNLSFPDYGTLDTYINTSAGAYYLLSFSAIAFDGTNSASVNVNGSLLATLNFNVTIPVAQVFGSYNTNWQGFSYVFQASSSLTEITFKYSAQEVDVPDSSGGYDFFPGAGGFDAISVIAVPEPSPSVLILFGGGVLVYVRHKTRQRS